MSENQIKQVELGSFLPYTINKIAALFAIFYTVFLFSSVLGIDAGFVGVMINGVSLTKYVGLVVLALGVFLEVYSKAPAMAAFVSLAKKTFNVAF